MPNEPAREAVRPIRVSHVVPAFDIVAFDFLLNRYDHQFIDRRAYDVTSSSIRRNLSSPWVIDSDPFSINQFMHPYQGSMYHGFARSAGLNYWESLGYTFAGSMLWEIAGETTHPSKNDSIASGIGGSFLGEPLFRLAELVLARGDDKRIRVLAGVGGHGDLSVDGVQSLRIRRSLQRQMSQPRPHVLRARAIRDDGHGVGPEKPRPTPHPK